MFEILDRTETRKGSLPHLRPGEYFTHSWSPMGRRYLGKGAYEMLQVLIFNTELVREKVVPIWAMGKFCCP
jgi:hypothetical protein